MNFAFLWRFAKFSPRKSIFKQLDTAIVGMVHWVTENSRKFSPRKSIFKQFEKVFSHERNPLGSSTVVRLRQTTLNHGKAIIAENCSLVQVLKL